MNDRMTCAACAALALHTYGARPNGAVFRLAAQAHQTAARVPSTVPTEKLAAALARALDLSPDLCEGVCRAVFGMGSVQALATVRAVHPPNTMLERRPWRWLKHLQ